MRAASRCRPPQEEIDELPRCVAIGQTEFRAVQLECFGTVALGPRAPSGNKISAWSGTVMAGTVFGLKDPRGPSVSPSLSARTIAARALRGKARDINKSCPIRDINKSCTIR